MTNLKRNPALAWKVVNDKTVILDLDGKRDFHQLNDVGSAIWNLCDGNNSLDEIADTLFDEFDAPSLSEIKSDIESYLIDLKTKGLLI